MSSTGPISAASPQIQAAATGNTLSAQKKEEAQAALKLVDSAAQATTQATASSGPQATGNNVDTIA